MAETKDHIKPSKKTHPKIPEKPPSWAVVRSIFTCKHLQPSGAAPPHQQQQPQHHHKQQPHHQQSQKQQQQENPIDGNNKKLKKMGCSGGSLCNNTRVMQRPETNSPEDHKKWGSVGSMGSSGSNSSRSLKAPLNEINGGGGGGGVVVTSSSSSASSVGGGSFRGRNFRRFSGCYECRMVVDPSHGVSRGSSIRAALCSCPDCGEIFMKAEVLELHQSVRHAVSELGPEDSSRNIVEIIFQSSWLKKQAPICKIDRILKVQNSQKTISRFEDYRDSIKVKSNKHAKKHPRCVADGNELLRFHSTTFVCSIGMNGSSNLCNLIPQCNVCSIIRNGFKIETEGVGICTTATSGKAHDNAKVTSENEKRAMLVCRVIAGRVKRNQDSSIEEYDSVAGPAGMYSDLDELFVSNPKAILPCFVVIYRGF